MINYLVGDATKPVVKKTIVAHGVSTVNAWGAGFVLALNKLSPLPQIYYRKWYRETICYGNEAFVVNDSLETGTERSIEIPFVLGDIQLVQLKPDFYIANMLTQKETGRDFMGEAPIRYDCMDECFARLAHAAKQTTGHISTIRIGCGLAGGTWDRVEPMIVKRLIKKGVAVDVYDLK